MPIIVPDEMKKSGREGQILDKKELKPNLTIKLMPEGKECKILSKPYIKDGHWWLIIKPVSDAETISLAKFGIVPYPNGSWEKENWLRKA